jgi:ribonuclease HII
MGMVERFDPRLLPIAPDLSFEVRLWSSGIQFIAGLDEAGRGSLAGPVAAGALILPQDEEIDVRLSGVRDSKQLSPGKREGYAACLRQYALAWGIGFASHLEIDAIGIQRATFLAMKRAIRQMSLVPQHLLVDYFSLPDSPIPQTSIVKGDARSLSIAGASILAKVARDDRMRQLDCRFPGYGFAAHKGYGTQAHRDALARLGPSPVHRRSFRFRA